MGYASDREVRGRSRSPGRPRRKEQYSLHVRNLDLSTTSEELRDLFGKHGSIRDVYIPRDYYSKQPRGFAYLEFTSKTEADAAIDALNGYSLNGRDLFVEYARGERKTSQMMRDRERRQTSPRRRSRSRSRSPHRRRRASRSPPRRRQSRSPPRRRSPSPPRRRHRTPSPRRRSPSPRRSPRRRDVSPRRRSPSPRRRDVSPSPRRRSASPRRRSPSRSRSPRGGLYRHLV
ncbi:RRM domain-containing protein [Plasmodiophora brassicae]